MEPFSKKIKLDSLQNFIDSVFALIEKTKITTKEYYPDALFLVDKYANNEIIYGDDISEEKDISMEQVIKKEFPAYIKESETKWYACACLLEDSDGYEILLVVFGDKHSTGACFAEVYNEGKYQSLEEWQEIFPEEKGFSTIIAPLRRGIVNQG